MIASRKAIGRRIKAVRKRRGLTQQDLSEMIDCSPAYLSYIENGTRSMGIETLVRISNSLNVTADELLVDVLENTIRMTNHIFADILADCSEFERRVLQDVVAATKASLRQNKR